MGKLIKRFKWNNIIWIIFIVILFYVFVSGVLAEILYAGAVLIFNFKKLPSAVVFITEFYAITIVSVLVLIGYCWIFKKNRFILRSFLPEGMGKDHKVLVVEDTYEPTQNNTPKMLLLGLLLGFLTNFACILCALINGNIKLYFDFSASQIPIMLYGLIAVFVQSSSEELWCRGFMYERIRIHYPLWVAVMINGAFFGLLHVFNEGATPLAIADIVVCGISFSLLRWYTGSIWIVMGLHTMWNFTQNFLFGLPNSGLVSEVSVFHLDAATGNPSLIYDYVFGVEGALPAVIADAAIGIIVLILAKKNGRLGELLLSYEKIAAQNAEVSVPVQAEQTQPEMTQDEPQQAEQTQPVSVQDEQPQTEQVQDEPRQAEQPEQIQAEQHPEE